MTRKLRVGVIFGGRSGEHEISLLSATGVMAAMDPEKYDIVPIGITKEGRWIVSPKALDLLKSGENLDRDVPSALWGSLDQPGILVMDGASSIPYLEQLDVVFSLLHGPYGEDGTVQGLLELADIPYVGAGVLASALGMDKAVMKSLFRHAGLPTADFIVVYRHDWQGKQAEVVSSIEARFQYPCFVKPANLGSSVGINKVYDRQTLIEGLDLASSYDRKILVEEFIQGREIECSVLGNDEPIASLPGEIVPARDFYDYEAKYSDDRTRLIAPVGLPKQVEAEVQDLAIRAFKAIDCAGMARVDFFLRPDGTVIINEINTIPGFTAVSMYPKLWEASGITFRELMDRLIQLALERHREKHRSQHARSKER